MEPLLARGLVSCHSSDSSPDSTFSCLKIMQFNTLADYLHDSFPYVDQQVLQWSYRRDMLVEEIVRYFPDVVCLEEVDHFFDHFEPALRMKGYEGIFLKKNNPHAADGCAVFYRSKYTLVKRQYVVYDPDHSQVAILVEFSSHDTGNFVVAATHLKASLGFSQLREKQAHLLIQAVASAFPAVRSEDSAVPLFVCGDFNDEPDSGAYRAFLQAQDSCLGRKLTSAYSRYDSSGKEPYSTYKKRETELCRTIDYIWYTPNSMTVRSLLEIPPRAALPSRLPAYNYPSDHLSLMGVFQPRTTC